MYDSDERDDLVRRMYDSQTGLVAKPTKVDEQVAAYEDPWSPPFFQRYLDFQRAPGRCALETRDVGVSRTYHYEWGELAVRGERASATVRDLLGVITLGANEEGEPAIGIHFFLR